MGTNSSKECDKGYTFVPENDEATETDEHSYIPAEYSKEDFKIYKRRYYILIMFSVASILQILIWNTWAPIASTAMNVLGWTQGDIALLSVWGGVVSAFMCIPFAGIMDKFGLRVMFLAAETLGLIGTAIRIIPVEIEYLRWTENLGQILVALAGPFLVQGPSLLSVTWFPPYQRTTATAIAQTSMGFGVAISFILGPMVVKEGVSINNETRFANFTDKTHVDGHVQNGTAFLEMKQRRIDEIHRLLYIEFALLAIMCAAAWIYFPAKPPTPPSISASKTREEFLPGLKILIKSVNSFWIPAIAYGICIGVPNTWATQLVIVFQGTLGLPQDTISWIAFYTYIGGVIGAFVASRSVDFVGGKMKVVVLALLLPATIMFVWLLLLCAKILPFNLPSLYISTICYGLLLRSTRPIYLEMVCEGVYPVAEGVTVGTLNWLDNIHGCLFVFVMMIPNIGQQWMNWTVLVTMLITVVLLLVFKEESKRLNDDKDALKT